MTKYVRMECGYSGSDEYEKRERRGDEELGQVLRSFSVT